MSKSFIESFKTAIENFPIDENMLKTIIKKLKKDDVSDHEFDVSKSNKKPIKPSSLKRIPGVRLKHQRDMECSTGRINHLKLLYSTIPNHVNLNDDTIMVMSNDIGEEMVEYQSCIFKRYCAGENISFANNESIYDDLKESVFDKQLKISTFCIEINIGFNVEKLIKLLLPHFHKETILAIWYKKIDGIIDASISDKVFLDNNINFEVIKYSGKSNSYESNYLFRMFKLSISEF